MSWEEKNALSFFYFRLLLLPADSPGGSDFSRAPRVLFWLIFRLVRPIFTFLFSMSFSCFSPLWRCDAFRLSSPRCYSGQRSRRRDAIPPECASLFQQFLGDSNYKAVSRRRVHRSALFFPSRIVSSVPSPLLQFSSVQSVIVPSGNFTQ